MRKLVTVGLVSAFLSALLASIVVASATAVVPKPYQWTTSDAQRYVVATAPQLQLPLGDRIFGAETPTVVKNCRGLGKASAKRFTSFRCSITVRTVDTTPVLRGLKPIWIKVRQQGRGQVCASLVSLGAIPAGCLKRTGTRSWTIDDFKAGSAVTNWLRIWAEQNIEFPQVNRHVTLHGYGAGYYEFSWQVVDFSNQTVPLQSHTGVAIFGGKWVDPGGCRGSGCPPVPGLTITQTS